MCKLFLILTLFISTLSFSQTPMNLLIPKKSTSCPTDVDAAAFITASGITDATICGAINQLVIDLKAASIWTKMKAIYPMVGGTATTCKFNLKDPRDLDAAFRIVWVNSPTFSANGVDFNGSTQYGDTKLNPSTVLTLNSSHISVYLRENTTPGSVDMGSNNAGGATVDRFYIAADNAYAVHQFNELTSAIGTTIALWCANRTALNVVVVYRRGSSITSSSDLSVGLASQNVYIGARNSNGSAAGFSDRQNSFATVGDGLNSTENAALYTIIQAFQTTLGRQV